MKIQYKAGGAYSGLTDFPFQEGDFVTIVIRFWTAKKDETNLYFNGHITRIEFEKKGCEHDLKRTRKKRNSLPLLNWKRFSMLIKSK